jgi:hypothetical protein
MHVSQAKVTCYPILSPLVRRVILWTLFFYVWGPPPTSVGRHNYYISFIDDHNKFVWIYLLKHKSKDFQCFHDFQKLVKRQFD